MPSFHCFFLLAHSQHDQKYSSLNGLIELRVLLLLSILFTYAYTHAHNSKVHLMIMLIAMMMTDNMIILFSFYLLLHFMNFNVHFFISCLSSFSCVLVLIFFMHTSSFVNFVEISIL